MDREFAFYLIELLDGHFPLRGTWGTLDFADRTQIGTYHINASLQLVIPLCVTLHDGDERILIEEAGLVGLEDEELAIEHIQAWGATWREAMHTATPDECRALASLEDICAHTSEGHPLASALTRRETLIQALSQAVESHFSPAESSSFGMHIITATDSLDDRTRYAQISSPPRFSADTPHLVLVARTIEYDTGSAQREIRNIKETHLRMAIPHALDHQHKFEAYIAGWSMALEHLFAHPTHDMDWGVVMPQDLFFPHTLDLKKCVDAETFASAHIVKSRLGKWMNPSL